MAVTISSDTILFSDLACRGSDVFAKNGMTTSQMIVENAPDWISIVGLEVAVKQHEAGS